MVLRARSGLLAGVVASSSTVRSPPTFLPNELQSCLRRASSPHSVQSRAAWTSALNAIRSIPLVGDAAASAAVAAAARAGPSSIKAGSERVPLLDPLQMLGQELGLLRNNVKQLLGSGHPALDTIAKYYFQGDGGKHIRPLIILLMSQATNGLAPGFADLQRRVQEREGMEQYGGVDDPLEPATVLNDQNPHSQAQAFYSNPFGTTSPNLSAPPPPPPPTSSPLSNPSQHLLLPTQRRLAEIAEMIHVASLLHDDVIDLADTRRSAPSSPSLFGNKLTILAGDFLLARASLALARLGSNEVVELVSSILANLVEGEVMQMKGNTPDQKVKGASLAGGKLTPEIFEHYMKKTYLKTASLIAKTTRASTILGGCGTRQGWAAGEPIKDIAYSYGRNVGIAFQLVDDMLDFTASAAQLGKPGGGADLKLGLATAPALYAWEEFPELGAMIERKFSGEDDVERARDLISRSSGAARTAELAEQHSKAARKALEGLPDSEARIALDELARDTLSRKK